MKFKEIYRRNIYGVMGTLLFHIILFMSFIAADVDIKKDMREEAVLIEFPDMPEPEIEQSKEENKSEQNQSELVHNTRTNIASNRLAKEHTTKSTNDFFDDDYQKELEAAQKLTSDVNHQLSKKVKDIDDIKMPVETTEGMDRDSIKNVIYAGESNIVYYLENRYHVRLPVPVYLSQGGGTVIVDIKVNRKGKVTEAVPRDNGSIRDKQILLYAQAAASKTVFNSDSSAPQSQSGSIHYTFVAQ
jgi:hypothetical protein